MLKKKYFILFFLSIITHVYWFIPNSIITHGDWYYMPIKAIQQMYYSWGTWISFFNFGAVNIQIPFNVFFQVWSLMSHLNLGFEISSKITFLMPIAFLSFFAPYLLSKKIIKDENVAITSALFFGSLTPVVINQLPIQFVYVISPLILYFFILTLEVNKIHYWLILVLMLTVGIGYEVRIMYIIFFILILYFLSMHIFNLKNYLKNIVISIIFLLLLNSYWLFPAFFTSVVQSIANVTSRGLFGSNLSDLYHAFNIHTWSWTGGEPNQFFILQRVNFYNWLIPLIAFSSLLHIKRLKPSERKNIIFFAVIALIGIFLTKQTSLPFRSVYPNLYKYLPGFSLFRDASKFYIFTCIGYLGLFNYLLIYLKRSLTVSQKFISLGIYLIIITISIINLIPLITLDIGTLFIPRKIPEEYRIVNSFISNQSNFFRVLWIPVYSRWSIYENNHPAISMVNMVDNKWNKLPASLGRSANLDKKSLTILFNNKAFINLIDETSIKYIIVPVQDKYNDDDFYIHYDNKVNYVKLLDSVNSLRKIDLGLRDIYIYENGDYDSRFNITSGEINLIKNGVSSKIDYNIIDSATYSLNLEKVNKPFYLNFSEEYHPDWKIRIGDFNFISNLFNNNYFENDSNHIKNDAGFNSYYIDPKLSCNSEKCGINADGTYSIPITVYFKPQTYLYLGTLISIFTFLVISVYLFYNYYINKDQKLDL